MRCAPVRGCGAHALLHLVFEVFVLDVAHEVLLEEHLQIAVYDGESAEAKADVNVAPKLHEVCYCVPDRLQRILNYVFAKQAEM